MSNQVLKNIDWPDNCKKGKRHFLEGFPIVGFHSFVMRETNGCLKQRTIEVFKKVWFEHHCEPEFILDICEKMKKITDVYFKRINNFYLPDDVFAIVVGAIPGVWYDAEDPVTEIQRNFHSIENIDRYNDIVLNGKFIDFVDLMGNRNCASRQSDSAFK